MSVTTCRLLVPVFLVMTASAGFAQESHTDAVLIASASSAGAGLDTASPSVESQASPAAAPRAPRMKGFSVVLLAGEVQGRDSATAGPSGDIPPAVQKALTSVQAFLPYKTYRLYDAALLSVSAPLSFGSVSALMRNSTSGQRTRVTITELDPRFSSAPRPRALSVAFSLTEFWTETLGATKPSDVPKPTTLMSATLSLDVGETVVVGTSQLGRDTGLIALLTAIPE